MERETPSPGSEKTETERQERASMAASSWKFSSTFQISLPPPFSIFLVLGYVLLVEIFFILSFLQSGNCMVRVEGTDPVHSHFLGVGLENKH